MTGRVGTPVGTDPREPGSPRHRYDVDLSVRVSPLRGTGNRGRRIHPQSRCIRTIHSRRLEGAGPDTSMGGRRTYGDLGPDGTLANLLDSTHPHPFTS